MVVAQRYQSVYVFPKFDQKICSCQESLKNDKYEKGLTYSALQKNSFFADFGKSGIAMFVIKTENW